MAEDETATVKPPTDVESICKHADQLFTDNKWREALDYLQQFSDTEDSELLWRLIRMNYRIGKKSSNRIEAKKFAEIATKLSDKAMALHENDFHCIKVWLMETLFFFRENVWEKSGMEAVVRAFDLLTLVHVRRGLL